MKKMIKIQAKGFTLVELLVVVGIIIILSAAGLVTYTNARQAAMDGKRQSDIETVKQALVMYQSDNGTYPMNGVNPYQGTDTALRRTNYTSVVGTLVSAKFLTSPAPSDPAGVGYEYRGNTTTFCVCADVTSTTKGNATSGNCGSFPASSGSFYCATQP